MSEVVCDASVVLKWFADEPGPQLEESRSLLDARHDDRIAFLLPELGFLEVGNVLTRQRRWRASRIETVMRVLRALVGSPALLDPSVLADAVRLAARHGLTVYDASYWALARRLDASLVTLDGALLAAGAGETPAEACERLGV